MVDYQFTIDEHPGYLHAKVVGPRTPENALRYLSEVYSACVRTGILNVLLEMNLSGPTLGAPGVFNVILQRAADGSKLGRVAYVEAADEAVMARFAETVALNRAVNIRLFPDVAQAARWLRGVPDPKDLPKTLPKR